jgi:hypothetical protein
MLIAVLLGASIVAPRAPFTAVTVPSFAQVQAQVRSDIVRAQVAADRAARGIK